MSDSRKKYWQQSISKLSPCALVERLFFVHCLLDSEEVAEGSSSDFFDEIFDILQSEVFFRYSKMVYDTVSSGNYQMDSTFMVSDSPATN